MRSMNALAMTGLLCASSAWAAFTPEQLVEATRVALADFKESQAAHADHFTGFKAWKSGDAGMVRIYIRHHGTEAEFNYHCVEIEPTDESPPVECHAL